MKLLFIVPCIALALSLPSSGGAQPQMASSEVISKDAQIAATYRVPNEDSLIGKSNIPAVSEESLENTDIRSAAPQEESATVENLPTASPTPKDPEPTPTPSPSVNKPVQTPSASNSNTQTPSIDSTPEPTPLPENNTANNSSDSDAVYWLSRIISAESQGEPLEGKIAVGNVVLNRVKSSEFPNTIYGVIFDDRWGGQFEPVRNGTIYQTPTEESVEAAKLCLAGTNVVGDSLYFLAPALAQNFWIVENREYVTTIGCHEFYR